MVLFSRCHKQPTLSIPVVWKAPLTTSITTKSIDKVLGYFSSDKSHISCIIQQRHLKDQAISIYHNKVRTFWLFGDRLSLPSAKFLHFIRSDQWKYGLSVSLEKEWCPYSKSSPEHVKKVRNKLAKCWSPEEVSYAVGSWPTQEKTQLTWRTKLKLFFCRKNY